MGLSNEKALLHVCRCCVRGVLLEVNERLIKDPTLLNTRVSLAKLVLCSIDAIIGFEAKSEGLCYFIAAGVSAIQCTNQSIWLIWETGRHRRPYCNYNAKTRRLVEGLKNPSYF